jgi:serine/threonine protein kinase
MNTDESNRAIGTIGRYRVTGELGRGGMGVVYKGEDRQIGRHVAIKTLTDVTPELRERFYIEARSGILSHQNIVTVYEVGEHEGRPFIAMEFVEGESLEKMLRQRKRLPLREALSIVEQICAGLGHAHTLGVVHRDVKPANVLVRPDGRVTIVDFGIARLADQTKQLTKTDTLLGTFHYIAPERLKGEVSDGRADLWSVGVMLYEMVTGALPFKGGDISSVYRVIHEPYVPVKEYVRNLPEGLSHVLDKALAKELGKRFATAEQMASDVHRLARELEGEESAEMRTVLMQTPRKDQPKKDRATDPETTQEVLQTIPLAVATNRGETAAPANHNREATRLFESPQRRHPEAGVQDGPSGHSIEAPKSQPPDVSLPSRKPSGELRQNANNAGLSVEHHRTTEIRNAVEKAVAACNQEIEANHFATCMRPLDDLTRQYGESPVLAAAREVCMARRSQKATHLLREAVEMASRQSRRGFAKDAEKDLKELEYALPFADADVASEWKRLKDKCADSKGAKQPRVAGASPAKRGKARWYAAGFVVVIAAFAFAAVSHRRHEVVAAPKELAVSAAGPAPELTDMEINASPWAKVVSVEDETGVSVGLPEGDHTTPLRLDGLKRGRYKVTFAGADGHQQTVECNVSSEERLCFADLGTPDTEQLLTGAQP